MGLWGAVWLEKHIDSLTRLIFPSTKIDLTPLFSRLARKFPHVSMAVFSKSAVFGQKMDTTGGLKSQIEVFRAKNLRFLAKMEPTRLLGWVSASPTSAPAGPAVDGRLYIPDIDSNPLFTGTAMDGTSGCH